MSNILYPLLLLSALFLGSCQKSEVDAPLEDYDRLFPFKGAEKPRISYEDQNIRLGDPDAPVSAFVYPGVKITEDVRTYRVTLTCSFKEADLSGKLVTKDAVDSRYVVRYVGATSSCTPLPPLYVTLRLRVILRMVMNIASPSRLNQDILCISWSMELVRSVLPSKPASPLFQLMASRLFDLWRCRNTRTRKVLAKSNIPSVATSFCLEHYCLLSNV